MSTIIGGERGIRTLGGVAPTHPFQGCTIDHSVISPNHFSIFDLFFGVNEKGSGGVLYGDSS